jgi:hypothetical protein
MYILLLAIYVFGSPNIQVSTTSAEFSSLSACTNAAESFKHDSNLGTVEYSCVQK